MVGWRRHTRWRTGSLFPPQGSPLMTSNPRWVLMEWLKLYVVSLLKVYNTYLSLSPLLPYILLCIPLSPPPSSLPSPFPASPPADGRGHRIQQVSLCDVQLCTPWYGRTHWCVRCCSQGMRHYRLVIPTSHDHIMWLSCDMCRWCYRGSAASVWEEWVCDVSDGWSWQRWEDDRRSGECRHQTHHVQRYVILGGCGLVMWCYCHVLGTHGIAGMLVLAAD